MITDVALLYVTLIIKSLYFFQLLTVISAVAPVAYDLFPANKSSVVVILQ